MCSSWVLLKHISCTALLCSCDSAFLMYAGRRRINYLGTSAFLSCPENFLTTARRCAALTETTCHCNYFFITSGLLSCPESFRASSRHQPAHTRTAGWRDYYFVVASALLGYHNYFRPTACCCAALACTGGQQLLFQCLGFPQPL